jgi:alkylation response protein AidB-like acyl-CoA dehydrogenase
MQRTLYEADHEAYRSAVREFLGREVVPHKDRWDDQHMIDRDVYERAAAAGVYALGVPEEYGGAGEADYRYRLVVCEEVGRVNALSFGLTLGL